MKRLPALCLGFSLIACAAAAQADGEGKRLFEEKCILCHGLERSKATQTDRTGWEKIIKRMVTYGSGVITEDDAAKILDYLAGPAPD